MINVKTFQYMFAVQDWIWTPMILWVYQEDSCCRSDESRKGSHGGGDGGDGWSGGSTRVFDLHLLE